MSQVVVHLAHLDLQRPPAESVWKTLSDVERTVACRFIFEPDRHRYVWSHYWLRAVLADRLQERPERLMLVPDEQGKPQLQHPERLQFNLSHTASLVAVAIAADRPVGVDIEATQRHLLIPGLAHQILTPAELTHWQALPASQQKIELLRYWCRKESLLKATGRGLRFPPRDVTTGSSGPTVIEGLFDQSYQIRDLPLDETYCGAITAVGTDWQLTITHQILPHSAPGQPP